jgi:hypothetical protein
MKEEMEKERNKKELKEDGEEEEEEDYARKMENKGLFFLQIYPFKFTFLFTDLENEDDDYLQDDVIDIKGKSTKTTSRTSFPLLRVCSSGGNTSTGLHLRTLSGVGGGKKERGTQGGRRYA